jgi:hypothetical protein
MLPIPDQIESKEIEGKSPSQNIPVSEKTVPSSNGTEGKK